MRSIRLRIGRDLEGLDFSHFSGGLTLGLNLDFIWREVWKRSTLVIVSTRSMWTG